MKDILDGEVQYQSNLCIVHWLQMYGLQESVKKIK